MGEHKGNPSGKNAENKKDAGRMATESKRHQTPESTRTQRIDAEGNESGRNRKPDSPV